MNSFFVRFALAIAVGGCAFFLTQAVTSALLRRRAPRVAQIQAELDEQNRLSRRPSVQERLRYWAGTRGYTGTLGPVVMGLSVVFLITSLVLSTFGVPSIAALILAVPLSWAVVGVIGGSLAAKRKALFDRQLLDALVSLSSRLDSGIGIQRALRQTQAASRPPLRTELGLALEQAEATRDLVGPLKELSQRYPSRAFDLFVAALQVDDSVGSRIEPAIKEAARTMQRDFALVEEAKAEISQAKSEFYGILVVMSVISVLMLTTLDPSSRERLFSPAGVLVLLFCAGWAGTGVVLALNAMRSAAGLKPAKLTRRRKEVES